ncbi:hypothetical protein K737_300252 [Holospora undulata HU1]|uniref:Uncharacterized protein n=1 Tax=Holospora undulata HU1 TaxID=1321371 RepID=A0A061JGQ5_9PROT|nr:hypothetical protein K737_300252 [Holospora undulata HU1]
MNDAISGILTPFILNSAWLNKFMHHFFPYLLNPTWSIKRMYRPLTTALDYINYCITPPFFVVFAFIVAVKMMLYYFPLSLLNRLDNSSSTPPGL